MKTYAGALEAFIGSSTWQFSIIAGSDAEVYQFSKITFLDKFPLQLLEMWNILCLDDFVILQNQLKSLLRCSLKSGWAPVDIHSLVECEALCHHRHDVMLQALKRLLNEKIVSLINRRKQNQ
jgi:hypothetical protein